MKRRTRISRSKNFNPQFKVNLVKVFNRSYKNEPREIRDILRGHLSDPNFRRNFTKAVIDRIVERTNEGRDKYGEKFAAYAPSYINSDIFKIYGKNAGQVNLELTGEMLSSLKGVETEQTIIIELEGKENKAKAHGHIHGIKTMRGKVVRDFLGLEEDDLDAIMLESIEQFRSEQFVEAQTIFQGQQSTQVFGRVGSQPEFQTGVDDNEIIRQLMRNLNGL